MQARSTLRLLPWIILAGILLSPSTTLAVSPAKVTVLWDRVVAISKTSVSPLVVSNPLLTRSSPIHAAVFSALRDLRADDVNYLAWFPYPKLGVAELQPPGDGKTY